MSRVKVFTDSSNRGITIFCVIHFQTILEKWRMNIYDSPPSITIVATF